MGDGESMGRKHKQGKDCAFRHVKGRTEELRDDLSRATQRDAVGFGGSFCGHWIELTRFPSSQTTEDLLGNYYIRRETPAMLPVLQEQSFGANVSLLDRVRSSMAGYSRTP